MTHVVEPGPHGYAAARREADGPSLTSSAEFHRWWDERLRSGGFSVERIAFDRLDSWAFDPRTGNLGHDSGRFFTVEGLRAREGSRDVRSQPIIHQPEIGILGIVVKEFNGVLHCLMQAKMEPGNVNTIQLSPTVQATRSNYTQVHKGKVTRYLERFVGPDRDQVLVDVLQSEQGAWFWRKRNRNMVVLATGDVPLADNFVWLTLAQVRELTQRDNLLNMDARTVLSCMSFALPDKAETAPVDAFGAALVRSYKDETADGGGTGGGHALHTQREILSWFTEAKTRCEWSARLVPMNEVAGWTRNDREIAEAGGGGKDFRIIAVEVAANTREVAGWTQPLLHPYGQAHAAFLTRPIDGVLHLLVRARPEYGLMDQVEMAPTVHLLPGQDLDDVSEPFLRDVLRAGAVTSRYDQVLSEEGGRFYNALTRYQILEAQEDFPLDVPPEFRWVTVRQLMDLLWHGHYLNVEARSLLTCLYSLR
ncbi:NDP-hexose 2,3-dehydratase family protein [Streptomyces lunaelactis]|uniref:NDP-hexose 2,3-dehydratase family protein n=1 Tax=Streptomyces lunaelactis TaxID=1535768 RepID=UPI001C54C9F3|nr:NDP-hexose 2,3-dehydratase family protein [Streptomyces lunaelactis]